MPVLLEFLMRVLKDTSLLQVTKAKRKECMKELMANKANVYAVDFNGYSALTHAAQVGCSEGIRLLLKRDAGQRGYCGSKMVKTKDKFGMIPMYHIMYGKRILQTAHHSLAAQPAIPTMTFERLNGVSGKKNIYF